MSRAATARFRPYPQRGAALMVMLIILVMGAAASLVISLSKAKINIERDRKSGDALAQAKEALIGRASSDNNMPGSLPCPDTNNDGSAEMLSGNDCPSYIGRLPWRTLKLADLRDGDGERLWYALSGNFRDDNSAHPLNSNTQGQLTLRDASGNTLASGVIAIVFVPGATIGAQSRGGADANIVTNFLEDENANGDTVFVSGQTSATFNDRLLAVSGDSLWPTVEKRVSSEIKEILGAYHTAWGAYPFAAPFADPATSTFTGQSLPATFSGLLPVGDNVIPTWAGIPTVTFSGSGGSDYCELRDDSAPNSRWRCVNITIAPGETITITGTLTNVGRGLWRPHHIYNVCEVRARNASGVNVLVTSVLDNASVTGNLNSNGSATIVFQATGKAGYETLQRIELRDISDYTTDIKTYSNTASCTPTSSAPLIPAWLFNDTTAGNNWHQVAYFAASPGYAPGGGNSCNPLPGAPPCLTVNGSGGANDKRAMIAMTGAALPSQSRPSNVIADYLEDGNATPADFIYENKARTGSFNDQVIIVAP